MSDPVRPTSPEPTARRDLGVPRWAVPLGAAAVLGLVFWVAGLATGGDPEVATTLDLEALPAASTTAPVTTAAPERRDAVHRRAATAEVVIPADIGGNLAIEGLSGRLATVTGQSPAALTLNLTPVGTTIGGYEQIALPPFGRDFGIDAGGEWLGFIGGGVATTSDLWLVPLDAGEAQVLPEITSFAWNTDRPRSLGWFNPTEGSAAEYQRAAIDAAGSLAHFEVSAVERNARLVAVAAAGMWRTFRFGTDGFVAFTDPGIGEVASRPADLVAVSGSADAALFASLSLDDWGLGWSILEAGSHLPLPWAPPDASMAAWRDDSTVAFAGVDGATTAWVEIWDLDGTPLDAFRMQYRVWDLGFSPDRRFLVMPGVDPGGTYAALLYDLDTRRLTAIVADDRIQFAGLVAAATHGLAPDTGSTS